MPDIVLLFLTVPLVTALIGWVTNWAAVKMIFHPTKFVGIGPIGWQAIIARQGDKFAQGVADMVTENIATAEELAGRLEPAEMQDLFESTIGDQTEEIVAEVADELKPGAWDELAEPVRTMIVTQVKTETNKLVHEVFDDITSKASQFFDLNRLVFRQLSGPNIQRLIRLTREIGHAEFKFIEYYGAVFGFVIGLAQIGVWSAMNIWWMMPIVGVVVGLITNYLAIQMIFRPHEPTKYLGIVKYQGLFPKRQKEIAADYGRVAAAEILTPKVILAMVSEGEAGAKVADYITRFVSEKLDEQWQKVKPMIPIEVTPEKIERVKAIIAARMTEAAPQVRPHFEEYLADKLAVREMVSEKLGELPKPEFERVLRGIFEEDELTLVLVGGLLGGGVGVLQGMLVVSLNL